VSGAKLLRKPANKAVVGNKRKGAKGISRKEKDIPIASLCLLLFAFCHSSLSPAVEKDLLQTNKRKAAHGITDWIPERL
jgi:hypothetical protein